MIRKELNTKNKRFLSITGLLVVAFSLWFILSSLTAYFLEYKAESKDIPSLKLEKIRYYKKVLSYVSTAIRFQKGNADYYVKKADYLRKAIEDGLQDSLDINKTSIENLYIKAIDSNPVNFAYHLKLGSFYASEDDQRAKKELLKAKRLYLRNKQTYFYLTKYYFTVGDYPGVISSLIWYFSSSPEGYWFRKIVQDDIGDIIDEFSQLDIIEENHELVLTIYPNQKDFYFEDKNLPGDNILFKLKVYVNGPEKEVVFYKNGKPYKIFQHIYTISGVSVYVLDLGLISPADVLADFSIKTKTNNSIDRLEVIFSLFPRS